METFVLERSWQELLMMGSQFLVYRVDVETGSALLFFDIRNNEVISYDFVWDPVAGGANVEFFRPQTLIGGAANVNKEILLVKQKGLKLVTQVFHGFNQPLDRIRLRLPSNKDRGQLANDDITGPVLGDPFGWWFEGNESPLDSPTGRGMFMMLQDQDIEMGLEHRTDTIVTPSSLWIENKLEVRPLDPSEPVDRERIVSILRGKTRSKFWSPGLIKVPYPAQVAENEYKVEPVFWDGVNAKTTSGVEVI